MEKSKDLPPRGSGLVTGNAGEPRGGVPRTDEEREARHEDMEKFTDFEGCVKHFLAQSDFHAKGGKTREESASALCAYIGRKSGKIASEDFTKDMVAAFDADEAEQSDLATVTTLVQELAAKVEELTAKMNEAPVEKDIAKSFEEAGYVTVPAPTAAINNLPTTKSDAPLSAEELKDLPWAKVHALAKKLKR